MGRADVLSLVPRVVTVTTIHWALGLLGTTPNTLQELPSPVFLRPRKGDIPIPIFQMRELRFREMPPSHRRSHSQEVTSLEAKLAATIALWVLDIYSLTWFSPPTAWGDGGTKWCNPLAQVTKTVRRSAGIWNLVWTRDPHSWVCKDPQLWSLLSGASPRPRSWHATPSSPRPFRLHFLPGESTFSKGLHACHISHLCWDKNPCPDLSDGGHCVDLPGLLGSWLGKMMMKKTPGVQSPGDCGFSADQRSTAGKKLHWNQALGSWRMSRLF